MVMMKLPIHGLVHFKLPKAFPSLFPYLPGRKAFFCNHRAAVHEALASDRQRMTAGCSRIFGVETAGCSRIFGVEKDPVFITTTFIISR
jgi:hypothetical protein